MRTKFWILGSFVACLCLSACGEDNGVATVESIAVTPATVTPLEVGGTVELTAAITPADATDPIKWVSEAPDIVSVAGTGTKATITAVKPGGPVDVYATNQAGIFTSNKIAVTVNPVDYAVSMLGSYSGSGNLTGMGMDQPLSGVQIAVAREGDEKAKVKVTLTATVYMPMPTTLTIVGNAVEISTEAGSIFTLSGKTEGLTELEGLWFTITGTFKTADKSLSLELEDNETTHLKIVLTAAKAN